MSRVQLALNVSDIDEAVTFYSKLFNVQPAKRRPGYANFAVDEPPLKLVLIENAEEAGSLNHLGVEVVSADRVVAATQRFDAEQMKPRVEDGVECCYALQDKVWVEGTDGVPWEIYAVLADAEAPAGKLRVDPSADGAVCCGSSDEQAPVAAAGTCC